MRVHSPPTSFSGYFTRRSPLTSSRTLAPLAQCVPWLIGLSQPGSCWTQTPFCTSATTVQPTKQWVQTFLRSSFGAPAAIGAASAFSTESAAERAEPREAARRKAGPAEEHPPVQPGLTLLNEKALPGRARVATFLEHRRSPQSRFRA